MGELELAAVEVGVELGLRGVLLLVEDGGDPEELGFVDWGD